MMTSVYSAEIDQVFRQARVDRVQCGWTTQEFLDAQGSIAPNVYLWRVAGSGRCTLVERVAEQPQTNGMVLYRELAR